ncbi:protein FAM184A-like isoform X2 [Anguilla anguilla]|uniref:protein FAM184A-like isoform X2 n=1 Tax=Anguilla anguilla TaxID=7936 RepID=UPI0015ACACCA|nr:protein FAM184A-like isoform X2 [Anguilla anguilla]
MASGTSWQQDYYGTGNSSSGPGKYNPEIISSKMSYQQSSLTTEYTKDMHLKMSKKIAQLTKVIYALNTKNDEQEADLQALKEAHDEEVQQILSETQEKILEYQIRIDEETDLRRRLQSLEESAELHERAKRQALAEFEAYRQHVEGSQLCTEVQHTQHIIAASGEAEEMCRDFEESLHVFKQTRSRLECDKCCTLEELLHAHAEEPEEPSLLHRAEAESLVELMEGLRQDRQRLAEEYEARLCEARAFYEHELEAAKRTQRLTAESLLAWKKTEAELRKEFQVQEAGLQRALGKMRAELQRVQEEARENWEKSNRQQTSLNTAESIIRDLHRQLDEAVQDREITAIRLQETDCELEASRDRVQQQATEILLKASQVGSLQAIQVTYEASLRELELEKSCLKEKVHRLEEERGAVLSKSQALDDQQKEEILALEKTLRGEKKAHEKEVTDMRLKYEKETVRLKEDQAHILAKLSEKHQAMLETTQNSAEKDKRLLLAEKEQQFDKERFSLEEQKTCLREQLETLGQELSSKLNTTNQEMTHLQEKVHQGELAFTSAQSHIASLKAAQEKLLTELDATRARLRETSNLLTALQSQMETQKEEHEARLVAVKTEEKLKMDKTALDLELKWTETLRQECKKLREELREEHEEEKRAALVELSQLKDQEMSVAREGWQRRGEDLLEQISLLKQSLELQLLQSQKSLQQLQAQFSQEREHLSQQLQELNQEHQQREQGLKETHRYATRRQEEAHQLEIKELEACLRLKQKKDLQSMREGHRRSLETLHQHSEQELQTLRFELEDEGKAKLASLRSELNHVHASAIEHLRQTQQQETAAAKLELNHILEQTQKQERDLTGQIVELQEELSSRRNRITNLDHEIHSLNETISTLTKELELKGQEVLRIRSEASQQMRAHEQDLLKKHEREMGELNATHSKDMQNMLSDFNKAQELLKDKISALQILYVYVHICACPCRLEGTENKFRKRESRAEDLQAIAELKDMVSEREALVKKLVDDKKFYQLELVNRETNFNKVFNPSPNVGVINPLVKQKRKNDKSGNRFTSSPSLGALELSGTGRGPPPPSHLDPAPNSPIHHPELDTIKPVSPSNPPLKESTKLTSANLCGNDTISLGEKNNAPRAF